MPSLYEYVKETGCKIDSHESDLYFPDTADTRHAIYLYQENGGACEPKQFECEIDGGPWFDAPFMYDPWWEAKNKQS